MKKYTRRIVGTFVGTLALFSLGTGLSAAHGDPVRANADAAPSSKIFGQSLTIEDNIHVNYAVQTENLLETDELGVLAWTAPQESYEYGTQNKVLPCTGTATKDSVNYPVFSFQELSAKKMTDVIYTRPYVLRDGNFHYGDVKKYSILEYAYNKLGKTEATPTENDKLKKFLNIMLDYGAAAQELFEYELDRLANDDYSYIRIENATFTLDGFNYGIYKVGAELEISLDAGFTLGSGAKDYFTVDVNGKVTVKIPEGMTVDTPSIVEKDEGSQNLAYTLNADGASYTLAGLGDCTDTDIIIPPKHEGLPVTKIASRAFYKASGITSVRIPAGITSIGTYAFYICDALANIEVDENNANYTALNGALYTKNGETLIQYAIAGTKTGFAVPDGVKALEGGAFAGATALTEIVLPLSLSEIGNYAFNKCTNLTSVYYKGTADDWAAIAVGSSNALLTDATRYYYSDSEPALNADGTAYDSNYWYYDTNGEIAIWEYVDGSQGLEYRLNDDGVSYTVTGIGTCTETEVIIPSVYRGLPVTELDGFYYGNQISHDTEKIFIPASVNKITDSGFGSTGLQEICVDENNPYFTALDGCLYNKDVTTLIRFPAGKSGRYDAPKTLTKVGENAFGCAYHLTEAFFYESKLTEIERWAFYQCRSLQSVVFAPSGLTSIGDYAFDCCDRLTTLVAAGAWTTGTVKLPETLTTIGKEAFYFCIRLRSMHIPASVSKIGAGAFNMSSAAHLPQTSLCYFSVDENNEYFTSIDGNLYTKDGTTLVCYATGNTQTSYTVPDGVTTITESAFAGAHNLTEVILPSTVAEIGSGAFSDCCNLTTVNISSGVEILRECVFMDCISLQDITIPEGVTTIEYYAFNGCDSLEYVTLPDSVTYMDSTAFSFCMALKEVKIGANLFYGSDFRYFDYCPALEYVHVNEGDAVTSIDGNVYSADGTALLFYAQGKTETEFIIPEGVTDISSWAFNYNPYYGTYALEKITLPSTLSQTTYDFPEVLPLKLPNVKEYIVSEDNAYFKALDGNLYSKDGTTLICYAAGKTETEFTVPESVTKIERQAFGYASSLKNVYVDTSIPDLYEIFGAYYSDINLENIPVNDNGEYISIDGNVYSKDGKTLIRYATGKTDTTFTLPDTVEKIDIHAFSGYIHVQEFIVGENNAYFTAIDGDLYTKDGKTLICYAKGKTATSFTLPEGVEKIEYNALDDCIHLTEITFPASLRSIRWAINSDNVEKIYFTDTNGWFISSSENAKGGVPMDIYLTDPAQTAVYLKTFSSYWIKNT